MRTGVVAFHRWFADGEGWCHESWYGSRLMQVVHILDQQLKSEDEGEFEQVGLGGMFIGEKYADPECLDPRAANRQPTILRVAFFAPAPTAEEMPLIRAALRSLPVPAQRGEQELQITIAGAVPRAHTPLRFGGLESVPALGLILVAILLVIGGLWWALY